MNTRHVATGMAALLLASAVTGIGAPAFGKPSGGGTSTVWTGNGITADGNGGYTLNTSLCDGASTPYLLFVLASSKSTAATITIASNAPVAMVKSNGAARGESSFKYTYLASSGIDLASLLSAGVTASYTSTTKVSLTVSHGCLGAPSPLVTVTFLGEGAPATNYWDDMGYYVSGLGVKVCETGTTAGCADFPNATGSATDKTVTLSTNLKKLDFIVTGATTGTGCASGTPKVRVFSSSVAADSFLSTTAADEFTGNGTTSTTATYSGGDHLYFATYCDTTSGGSSLTVTFIGEFQTGVMPLAFGVMGSDASGLGVKVCENGSTTLCSDFPVGTAVSTDGTITLSGAAKTLDFTTTGGGYCALIKTYSDAILASDYYANVPASNTLTYYSGAGTKTTSTTYNNGDHVYFVTKCDVS